MFEIKQLFCNLKPIYRFYDYFIGINSHFSYFSSIHIFPNSQFSNLLTYLTILIYIYILLMYLSIINVEKIFDATILIKWMTLCEIFIPYFMMNSHIHTDICICLMKCFKNIALEFDSSSPIINMWSVAFLRWG